MACYILIIFFYRTVSSSKLKKSFNGFSNFPPLLAQSWPRYSTISSAFCNLEQVKDYGYPSLIRRKTKQEFFYSKKHGFYEIETLISRRLQSGINIQDGFFVLHQWPQPLTSNNIYILSRIEMFCLFLLACRLFHNSKLAVLLMQGQYTTMQLLSMVL